MKKALAIILLLATAHSLFATERIYPYLRCGKTEYTPFLEFNANVGSYKTDNAADAGDEKTGGFMKTYGGEISGRVHVWHGLVSGNANYVEMLYRGYRGDITRNGDKYKTKETSDEIELNFYEMGYKKYQRSFAMAGLGYREYKREYTKDGVLTRSKNPYFQIGVGGVGRLAGNVWTGLEGYAFSSFLGKSDVEYGYRGQTVEQHFTYGFRAVFPIEWRFSKHVEGTFRWGYNIWLYGDTNEANTVKMESYRNDTMTLSFGLRIKLF